MYADIAVCLPLARTFIYKLTTLVETGCRVVVPFRKREVEGFVVGFRKEVPPDIEVHEIGSVLDAIPSLRPDVFKLSSITCQPARPGSFWTRKSALRLTSPIGSPGALRSVSPSSTARSPDASALTSGC